MNQFAKEVISIFLEEEMCKSYLDYAMSVIVGRALPDVRDGLKPVHRRVLFAMYEMNNLWNRSFVKCARVVGETMGKYHPHGDSSIYDALVRMAQPFSLRCTLVDGQGNFGSIDGDSAAAMRYTECRLNKISNELLIDLDKETIDFISNYDGKEKEPSVLPARIPNLLINGSSGIAVGMATNIPPHNLTEVINGVLYVLHNPECSINDLIKIIPAPDFPTAGIIYGLSSVHDGYYTGKGRVIIRAKTHIEEFNKENRTAIIIDELPYQVNKKSLLEKISRLVKEKKLECISHLRDESDKSGMRIVIEINRNEIPEIVLNKLYKQTQLQNTFGMNMLALVNGQPKLLNLKEILYYFILHRREIIKRRTIFELRKMREYAHILEGLTIALANIDNFIQILRSTSTPQEAKKKIIESMWNLSDSSKVIGFNKKIFDTIPKINNISKINFGLQKNGMYKLSDIQAQEILQMPLQRLTNIEQKKIINKYENILNKIMDLTDILSNPKRITEIITDELNAIKNKYGGYKKNIRRSEITLNVINLSTEDLIASQDMVITLSNSGYIKSQPISEYRAQKRGGRGKKAMITKDEDWINQLFIANTHDYILCFSNYGRLYWLKVWKIPQGSRNSRGKPIINMFLLKNNEKITVILPLSNNKHDFPKNNYVFMSTSLGIVKKTLLSNFSHPRKSGIIAVNLSNEDFLIGAALTDGSYDIMLFSDSGKAVRFNENSVRAMGRSARGVRGMRLEKKQKVIALLVSNNQKQSVLTVTENGYGKRTLIKEYTRHNRGTKGIISIKTNKRNGKVVAATLVNRHHEIMLITTGGILIRTRVSEIRKMRRSTQGVILITIENKSKLCGVQRVMENDIENKKNNSI
ncbi:DNA gyrase subunit A [Candidatus Profftella armatura (Diaphorina cf. continua)]|uniref:DNA gyrase subunit A n=1 Tax=Candidatus Profftella armatura (Diaphorina cf. continua) TaxID=2661583 RepID=A0A7R6VZU3_9PROT|nr:DNA gyrase subunit A [Candidatus Profftella armatura (Diaphorina cf. continua)]BCG49676.1 DNA gyrase subunit A [Candidatus Profftella armatura (Diaphorina cf. continua)]